MKVVIPSKGRPNFLSLSVFRDPIVFIEPQDFDLYRKANPNLDLAVLGKNNGGISYAKNQILKHMGSESFCIADDDIKELYRCVGKVMKKVEAPEMLDEVDAFMGKNHIAAMGLPTKAFAWCQKGIITKNAKIINIAFINGEVLEGLSYDENISHGEDVDFCIQLVRCGFGSYSYNRFTYTNAKGGSQPGGCQGMRSLDSMLKDVEYMNRKWGEGTVKAIVKNNMVSHRVKYV